MTEDKNSSREVRLVEVPTGDRLEHGHPPPNALQEAHMQAVSTPQKPPTKPPRASADSATSATPPKVRDDS